MTGIIDIEILPKQGRFHNEMTGYRYDVVIHMDGAQPSPSSEKTGGAGTATMRESVARPEAARLTSATDRNALKLRLASDLSVYRWIEAADDSETVESVKKAIPSTPEPSVEDPGMALPFDVADAFGSDTPRETGWWTASAVGSGAAIAPARSGEAASAASSHARRRMATDPLEAAYMQRLGLDLFRQLSDRLPETLLPAAVFAVRDMPTNARQTRPSSTDRPPRADDELTPPFATGRN